MATTFFALRPNTHTGRQQEIVCAFWGETCLHSHHDETSKGSHSPLTFPFCSVCVVLPSKRQFRTSPMVFFFIAFPETNVRTD